MMSRREECRLGVGAVNSLHRKMGDGREECGYVRSVVLKRGSGERGVVDIRVRGGHADRRSGFVRQQFST